jgi:cytochrome c-type biogenesis protein CcmH/NrfG
MSESHAFIVVGTAASSLLALLILLRIQINGQRPILALTRRWVATPSPTSTLVIALVSTVALSAFAAITRIEADTQAIESTAPPSHTAFDADEDLAALRTYATSIEEPPHATTPSEPLPGVEEMIAKLKARLDQNPSDVKGWKMLGWSYLNMGQPAEASRAYEAALKLAPADTEITSALAAAKSAAAEPPIK